MAIALSWQAEQAATIGDTTSVVPCAWHGVAGVQAATTAVQGCAVVQVQGVPVTHAVVTVPIFWVNVTGRLLTVYAALIPTLQGLVALQAQGAAGVQLTVPADVVWVPLMPSGSVALMFPVENP